MKAKTIEDITLDALMNNQPAREDDFRLYGSVLKRLGVNLGMTVAQFLMTAKKNNMPSLESVPRARRKILESHPELESEQTRMQRQNKQMEYEEYSKEI